MTRHLDTRLLHTGTPDFDSDTRIAPVNVPTVRTSTVRFADTAAYGEVFRRKAAGERIPSYGRQGMDTHHALQDAICLLEGGQRCFLTPSGASAAAFVCLALLSAGDHALITDSVYAPVRKIDTTVLKRMGIEVSYYTPDGGDVESLIRPNTRMIYAEAPGSLLFEMQDMPALAQIAKRHDLLLVADNTWGSGYLYRPLELGADVSLVAATKYIGGHSDLMMGAVVVKNKELGARMHATHYALGLTIGADDASLALRGVRTLALRLAQHGRNAMHVAAFLQGHPAVSRVWCPALPEDPGYALWQRDCKGTNGLLSITLALASREAAMRFIDALELFGIGFSWGGYESLVTLVEEGELAGHSCWTDGERPLVRLHVGLESADDLIHDLRQAFVSAGLATA